MKTLLIDLNTFGFVEREKDKSNKTVTFRCGRDFLYYSLNFYYPEKFNHNLNNPKELEQKQAFGLSLPIWLYFTSLQFIHVPKLLSKNKLELFINNKQIDSFFDFFLAIARPTKISAIERIKQIENAVDNNFVSGINFSFGLKNRFFDHVMMVYGYDEDNLYVFDTHKVPNLEYEKLTQDDRYIMKLPKKIIKERWSVFGRVWIIKPINSVKGSL